MGSYLRIDSEIWRLPADLDPTVVHSSVVQAMQGGQVIRIAVETVGDSPRQTYLTLNGRAIGQFALVEAD